MKNKTICLFLFALLSANAFSCREALCVSCISQDPTGKIVDHSVACDKSRSYSQGFEAGVKQREEEKGNTVTCTSYYGD